MLHAEIRNQIYEYLDGLSQISDLDNRAPPLWRLPLVCHQMFLHCEGYPLNVELRLPFDNRFSPPLLDGITAMRWILPFHLDLFSNKRRDYREIWLFNMLHEDRIGNLVRSGYLSDIKSSSIDAASKT
jgi:hypothetical protein